MYEYRFRTPATAENRAPEFTNGTGTTRSVAENTRAGVNIGAPVAATDDDGDTLTYSLGGSYSGIFSIGTSSGQLRTRTRLDYETRSSYTVTVSVHDGKDAEGNADTTVDDSVTVGVAVTDVNDAPRFPSATATRRVAENMPSGTPIGSPVAATDDDGDTLTYSLGGSDGSSFTIDSGSGQLSTRSTLESEVRSSYRVTVGVTDGRGGSDSIGVTIAVIDVDGPLIVTGTARVDYPENGSGAVASYTARGTGSAGAAWSLSGNDSDDFSISAGVLSFNALPDYEAASDLDADNEYRVTVEATAGGDNGTLDATVMVTDVDLGTPYDLDNNEIIDKDEAIKAVLDYFDGVITKDEAIEVVILYFTARG